MQIPVKFSLEPSIPSFQPPPEARAREFLIHGNTGGAKHNLNACQLDGWTHCLTCWRNCIRWLNQGITRSINELGLYGGHIVLSGGSGAVDPWEM